MRLKTKIPDRTRLIRRDGRINAETDGTPMK